MVSISNGCNTFQEVDTFPGEFSNSDNQVLIYDSQYDINGRFTITLTCFKPSGNHDKCTHLVITINVILGRRLEKYFEKFIGRLDVNFSTNSFRINDMLLKDNN